MAIGETPNSQRCRPLSSAIHYSGRGALLFPRLQFPSYARDAFEERYDATRIMYKDLRGG